MRKVFAFLAIVPLSLLSQTRFLTRGRASRLAFPGRAWEREKVDDFDEGIVR